MKPVKHLSASLLPGFNSLWDEFLGRDFFDFDRPAHRLPAVNVQETSDAFVLEFALPGLRKEDVKIELDQNLLTLSSHSRQESESQESETSEGNGTYTRREFHYHSFRRAFTLPDTVDSSKIQARSADGILYVTLPKREEAKVQAPRLIDIQ